LARLALAAAAAAAAGFVRLGGYITITKN